MENDLILKEKQVTKTKPTKKIDIFTEYMREQFHNGIKKLEKNKE